MCDSSDDDGYARECTHHLAGSADRLLMPRDGGGPNHAGLLASLAKGEIVVLPRDG